MQKSRIGLFLHKYVLQFNVIIYWLSLGLYLNVEVLSFSFSELYYSNKHLPYVEI